jgi:hypothetical protein
MGKWVMGKWGMGKWVMGQWRMGNKMTEGLLTDYPIDCSLITPLTVH